MANLFDRLLLKKSILNIQAEAARSPLKRSLGALNLTFLGIGAIIGAGIFSLTGQVASANAGPAIMISFIIAGIVCAVAGLCYAELASILPVSGSAYTYAYGTLGEVGAWVMGWLLVLEYGIAAATVAVSFSGYVVSTLHMLGVNLPSIMVNGAPQPMWATPLVQAVTAGGHTAFPLTGTFNLAAALGILAVTALLVIGVSESAKVNNVIVVIKVLVLVTFVAVGISYINPANWHPFIPAPTGEPGVYGWSGILRGSAIIFFAYVGFEAVSTAAAEAKKPSRDVPIGILGSLVVCTVIYMLVAAVMTGVVPYKELASPAPVAVAIDHMGLHWADVPYAAVEGGKLNIVSLLVKIGAITGLFSVMLVLTYAQTRVFYNMSKDGLLPKALGTIHPKLRTPVVGTVFLGIVIAITSAFLPISLLGDLVSLGTAVAFSIVCLSVIYMRIKHPELDRPFKVPGGAWTAGVGIFLCLFLAWQNFAPMIHSATKGDMLPINILGGYLIVGVLVYVFYGFWHSKLAKGIDVAAEQDLESVGEAFGHGVDDHKK